MTFKKYPSIERLGHEDTREILLYPEDTLVIEEKVDGGNGSFWVDDDHTVHFGSRNRDLTLENDNKMFAGIQMWLREHLNNLSLQSPSIYPNLEYIYYIEWMQKHTIGYTSAPHVIGLDIRLKRAVNSDDNGLFLGREAREQEFTRLGITNTPLLWRGTVKQLKELAIRDLISQSKFYNGLMEGIVIKNYCRKSKAGNHQLYAKLVRDEFKEDNKAVFGSVKNKESDTTKIIEQFCTDARVRKTVLKFVNEDGMKLDLTLMKHVPGYVIKDILKEEFSTIFERYHFIDFKEMKQKVPKICLRVIREMMEETVK